jgi:hypothetical protein
MLSGDLKVYSVPKNTKTNLDKGLKDLRDKRLMPVDFDKLAGVEISGAKLHLTFGSEDGKWTVRSPATLRGDTSKMETIIEKLRTTTMDPSTQDADMKKAASLFASGAPIATHRQLAINSSPLRIPWVLSTARKAASIRPPPTF